MTNPKQPAAQPLEAAAVGSDGWKDATKELPDEDSLVLVAVRCESEDHDGVTQRWEEVHSGTIYRTELQIIATTEDGNEYENDEVLGWRELPAPPTPAQPWSDSMKSVLPCGHTQAQHEYYQSGELKLERCEVVKNLDSCADCEFESAVHAAHDHTPDWRTMGIVEIAAENQSVSDYIEHWEGRALDAEKRIAELSDDAVSGSGEGAPADFAQWQRDALKLIILLRCDAELQQGCTKEVARAMGEFLRGEKVNFNRDPLSDDAPVSSTPPVAPTGELSNLERNHAARTKLEMKLWTAMHQVGLKSEWDAQEKISIADLVKLLSSPVAPTEGRYAIDRPCSACSAGDTNMEHHTHSAPFRMPLEGPDAEAKEPKC
jgi:hypothetical protein